MIPNDFNKQSQIFLIGDLHIGDDVIRKLEGRPFQDSITQTKGFVELWNQTVQDEDIVYVLGDFIHPNADSWHIESAKKLKGHKYLILGNHDTLSESFYRGIGFEKIYDVPIVIEDFWILSHEPKYINKIFPYANIFAHVHNNPIYKTYSERHYCVSAERINFKPMLFDEIKKIILKEAEKSQ